MNTDQQKDRKGTVLLKTQKPHRNTNIRANKRNDR